MPRAALLSIHARVKNTVPTTWEHTSLLQIWGPKYSVYVVASKDLPLFSLGRLPEDDRGRKRALETASRLHAFLDGRRMSLGQAGREMRLHNSNSIRYGATTGRILIRWEGARDSIVWTGPELDMDPRDARLQLARRYLHVFGPSTEASFADWAGIRLVEGRSTFEALKDSLTRVGTPIGDAWILSEDEAALRAKPRPPAPARLLPSGDAYYLMWGADRKLLIPNAKQRSSLWTSRVWPGALLVNGEIVGVWRRAGSEVSIEVWRRLSRSEQQAVEAEATSLPLPGLNGPIVVRWS